MNYLKNQNKEQNAQVSDITEAKYNFMTKTEFITGAYKILDSGKIEHDNQIYYSEESVMKCLEWMAERGKDVLEFDAEKAIETLNINLKNIMEQFEANKPFEKQDDNGKYTGTFNWDITPYKNYKTDL